jgi:hypothetical protein
MSAGNAEKKISTNQFPIKTMRTLAKIVKINVLGTLEISQKSRTI